MTVSESILIPFGVAEECPYILLEIPQTQVQGGQKITIRLWSATFASLQGYSLMQGLTNLGVGKETMPNGTETIIKTEEFVFAEDTHKQLTYPIQSIIHIKAKTSMFQLIKVDEQNSSISSYASAGEILTSKFHQRGGSCVGLIAENSKIYGTVEVKYEAGKYARDWEWTVPSYAGGLYWFFIKKNNIITHKFSLDVPAVEGVTDIGVPKVVYIRCVDVCTEIPVVNAEVYIDGVLKGTTDIQGVISLELTTGDHSIKCVAPGYTDTDLDNLDNDMIWVM